jgi:hypothetical protein
MVHNKVGLDADNPFIQLGDHNKFAGVTNGDGLAFDQDGYAMQFNGAVLMKTVIKPVITTRLVCTRMV